MYMLVTVYGSVVKATVLDRLDRQQNYTMSCIQREGAQVYGLGADEN